MPKGPTLSICIPNYNMGQWICGAVDSALAVIPHESVEVVIADNSSTDGSLDVLTRYAPEQRVRILAFQDHVPMAENWNRAVIGSTGEWCLLLSADDEVLPGFFTNLLTGPLLDPAIAAVSQGAEVVGLENVGFSLLGDAADHRYSQQRSLSELIPWNPFPLCSTAFRREAFDEVGGFISINEYCDYHFWLRCVFVLSRDIASIGKIGARYYVTRGNTGISIVREGEDLTRIMALLDDIAPVIGSNRSREMDRALVWGTIRGLHTLTRVNGPVLAIRNATSVLPRASRIERTLIRFFVFVISCGAWRVIFPLKKHLAVRTRVRRALQSARART
ncbi:MAG: glycosyltransferase family 2 protein [Acidimicrobiales bacterium]